MLIITFEKEGIAVSDFEAREWVELWVDNINSKLFTGTHYVSVSTSLPIDYFRLAVASGSISCSDICFRFEGETLEVNEHGAVPSWPEGFGDESYNVSMAILRESNNKKN